MVVVYKQNIILHMLGGTKKKYYLVVGYKRKIILHMLEETKERLFCCSGIQTKYYSTYVKGNQGKIIL